MLILYRLAVFSYGLLIRLIAPFNSKAGKWVSGRKKIFRKLEASFLVNKFPVVWFHCASLGEFEQARPVIESFRLNYPSYKILLTFFSPSGYEIRKNYPHADYIFYLPLDTPRNARKFVEITNPEIAFFVKYEFWYFLLSELHRRKKTIVSFSAIFRPDQYFFKPNGELYRNLLRRFDRIFVQNQASLELLNKHRIHNGEMAGDTRFDRVRQICDQRKEIPEAETFKAGKRLLIIGSAWKQDMDVLMPFINNYNKELKVIIAPHEIKESYIAELQKEITRKSIRFSSVSSVDDHALAEYEVLIIDNIGMLSSLYAYADFAYVGGAFGKGLHNILEAATFGMPVFFGPNYDKFQEAKDLLGMGCAFSITRVEDFYTNFDVLYQNDSSRKFIALKAKEYVKSNTGATSKIMDYCHEILK